MTDLSQDKPVEKNTTDVVVTDGGLLGAGGHSQGPEEAVDQDVELVDILRLSLDHGEHNLVSFPHTFSMRRTDVILHDSLPFPSTQPSSHEALNLQSKKRRKGKVRGRRKKRRKENLGDL